MGKRSLNCWEEILELQWDAISARHGVSVYRCCHSAKLCRPMSRKQVARIAFIARRRFIFARIVSRYVAAPKNSKRTSAHIEPYKKSPSSTEQGRSQSGRSTTPKLLGLLVGCGKVTPAGKRYLLTTSFDVEVILNLRAHLRKFDEDIKPSPTRAVRGYDQIRESTVLKCVAHIYCDDGRRHGAPSHVHWNSMNGWSTDLLIVGMYKHCCGSIRGTNLHRVQ